VVGRRHPVGVVDKRTAAPARIAPRAHTSRASTWAMSQTARARDGLPRQEVTSRQDSDCARRPRAAVDQSTRPRTLQQGRPTTTKKAVRAFRPSRRPNYSQAALYLGRVVPDLFQDQEPRSDAPASRLIPIISRRAHPWVACCSIRARLDDPYPVNAVVHATPNTRSPVPAGAGDRMKELYPDP